MSSLLPLPQNPDRRPLPAILVQFIDDNIKKHWPAMIPSSFKTMLRDGLVDMATDIYNQGIVDAKAEIEIPPGR